MRSGKPKTKMPRQDTEGGHSQQGRPFQLAVLQQGVTGGGTSSTSSSCNFSSGRLALMGEHASRRVGGSRAPRLASAGSEGLWICFRDIPGERIAFPKFNAIT